MFSLAFPYVIFVVILSGRGIGNIHGFYRTEPLRTLDDPLFTMGITNYRASDGLVCMGDTAPKEYRSWAQGVERILAHFWQARFNEHWPEQYNHYRSIIPEMRTIWDWEYWSHRNPLWPLSASWTFSDLSLQRFCSQRDVGTSAGYFRNSVAKARSATEWRDGKPIVEDQGYKPSASLSVIVGSFIVRQGDTLIAQRDSKPFCRGTSYRVAFFYERRNDHHYAKLDGINEPVCLQCGLGNGDLILSNKGNDGQKDFFVTEGIPLVIGMKFLVTDEEETRLSKGKIHVVVEIQRDADGDIFVKIEGSNNWYYLTHSGGTLLPSVRFLISRLEGNTFQYGDKELSVGQAIKISRSSHAVLANDMVVRVASLTREETSPARFMVTFDGIQGSLPLLNGGNFTFEWKTYVCESVENKITFGEHVLDLTWGHHLLPIKQESGLRVGHLYQVLAIVPNDKPGHHPFDCDLILKYGNAPVPLIWKSKWMLTNGTTQVATDTFTLGDLTLRRGQTVRYSGPNTELLKTNTDLKVLGFVKSAHPNFTEVVFENGISALICEEITGRYYQVVEQGSCRNIPGLPSAQTIFGSNAGGRGFVQDDLAVLVDADGLRDNKQFLGQVCVVKGINEPWDGEQELRVIFLSDLKQEIRSIRKSRFKHFGAVVAQRCFIPSPLQKCVGDTHDLNHPNALAFYLAGPLKGRLEAGKDHRGHVICVGDTVKVMKISENMSYKLMKDGIHENFFVIGRGQLSGNGKFFLYLLVRREWTLGINTNVYGFDELLGIYKTNEIMRCIALNLSDDCEYVDWKPKPTAFFPGQHVCVKIGVTPRYGFGKVQMGEIGRVVACMEEEVQVCFEGESEWIGLAEELELVPVLGDRVSLNTTTPRYLAGSTTPRSVGVIRGMISEEPDLFLVDFPGHEGFHARLDELTVV